MSAKTRSYTSPDGTDWVVQVMLPGATNAMIVFEHPDGGSSRRDRYNWVNIAGPGAKNVTSRAESAAVLRELTDTQIALLFRRSMPISAGAN
ncbi:MAG TPA: hypothetical protein VGO46_01665 [Gemmatimonadaceae bacterium]|nr:hypothetical protein [Gemmatimonadaceae bacterium]